MLNLSTSSVYSSQTDESILKVYGARAPMNASTSLYLTNQHFSYSMLAMFKSHIILTLFFFHLTDIMSFPFQVVQQREIMFVYIKASPTTSIG